VNADKAGDRAHEPGEYTISQLAEDLGVTPRAIRFYEDQGLVSPRRLGQMRVYSRRDRGRLVLILRGKRLGFSLGEIGEWLNLYDVGDGQRAQLLTLRSKGRARIRELERQKADLELTLSELREIDRQVTARLHDQGLDGATDEAAA
jgi:DNA-binding transcriptional MerR regulator